MMSGQAQALTAAGERLAAFGRVFTTDVDEAAAEIGRIFCPHRLDPIDGTARNFHARHNSAAFDGFSVNYVSYGGSVSIDPGCLDRFFLLQVPVRGSAKIRTAGRDIDTAPGRFASLLTPTLPTQMIWADDCAQMILLVDRQLVERRAAALAESCVRAVEFDPEVNLASPLGRALQGQIDYLADVAERHGPGRMLTPAATAMLRESVLGLLLTGQRHSLSDAIDRQSTRDVLPGYVKRARAYLDAHAAEPLDLDKLAQVCGTGVRSLQLGFKRCFGLSLSEALLDIRLDRLRQRLSAAAPDERIIDIALDLGFTHLSRTAKAYQSKFGEKPSDTLRNAR